MAQLTTGYYYRRDWRVVQLLTSSTVGSLTVWQANLLGPIGGSDPLGVDSAVQYQESGEPLPPTNVPPAGALATVYNPATDYIPAGGAGGSQSSDLMYPIGTVSTLQGMRG